MTKKDASSDVDLIHAAQIPEDVKEGLERLPEEERQRIIIEMTQSYCGPVMPPQLLRQIEEIIPGGAERVLLLSEKEQAHRHRIVEEQMGTEAWQTRISLSGGLAAFVLLICAIMYCSVYGYVYGVVALGSLGAFGVVSRIVNLPNDHSKRRKKDQ